MVAIEPDYEMYNKYPIEINNNYCGDDCNDEKIPLILTIKNGILVEFLIVL